MYYVTLCRKTGKVFSQTHRSATAFSTRFDQLYLEDKRFWAVFATFALLALFVGTLALFGLASFLALQRTKEVGVGASIGQIIGIFYRSFPELILVAFGVPVIFSA